MRENLKMTGKFLMLMGTMCLMFVFVTRLEQKMFVSNIETQITETTTIEQDITALMKDTFDIKVNLSGVQITDVKYLWKSDIDTNFITHDKMDSNKRKRFIKYASRIINDKKTRINEINEDITQHNRLVTRYPTRWALPGRNVISYFQL